MFVIGLDGFHLAWKESQCAFRLVSVVFCFAIENHGDRDVFWPGKRCRYGMEVCVCAPDGPKTLELDPRCDLSHF